MAMAMARAPIQACSVRMGKGCADVAQKGDRSNRKATMHSGGSLSFFKRVTPTGIHPQGKVSHPKECGVEAAMGTNYMFVDHRSMDRVLPNYPMPGGS